MYLMDYLLVDIYLLCLTDSQSQDALVHTKHRSVRWRRLRLVRFKIPLTHHSGGG